ncbi:MAG: nitroreductase family protein [Caulobacteraceae bacterium]
MAEPLGHAAPPAYQPIPLPDRVSVTDTEALARAEAVLARMRRRHTVRAFSDRPVPQAVMERCIAAAATAPSGANLQPWRFVLVGPGPLRSMIRAGAEAEEQAFYAGRAGAAWLEALAPLGTDAAKPFLETAPWLVAVFGQRFADGPDGRRIKTYYTPESVGIATGFLITALHECGLATLTHTPSPMGFLNRALGRPPSEKPYVLLVVGHPAADATVPAHAKRKLPLGEVLSVR